MQPFIIITNEWHVVMIMMLDHFPGLTYTIFTLRFGKSKTCIHSHMFCNKLYDKNVLHTTHYVLSNTEVTASLDPEYSVY